MTLVDNWRFNHLLDPIKCLICFHRICLTLY